MVVEFFFSLDVGTKTYLVIYRMPNKKFPMNISNLKLRLVRILFGERIQDVPHLSKEVGHQLVHICINATESNFCG